MNIKEFLKNEKKELFDLIIVGGGPVGLYAAFYAGIRNIKVKIIESLSDLGGQVKNLYPSRYIYDLPGFPKILAEDLIKNLILQYEQFNNVSVVLNQTVQSFLFYGEEDVKFFSVSTQNEVHYAKAILITIGLGKFIPKRIAIDNLSVLESNKLVHYFLKDPTLFKNKKLAIFGGGDSAIGWAINLIDHLDSLYLIHRSDVFRGSEVLIQQLYQHPKVKVILFHEINKVELSEDQLSIKNLILKNIENPNAEDLKYLNVDHILFNLGFISDPEFVKNWNLEFYNDSLNFKVNRKMQSSFPGIWSAGDVVSYEGKLKLLCVGFSEAIVAINSIKNYLMPSSRFFPGHSTHFKKGVFKF